MIPHIMDHTHKMLTVQLSYDQVRKYLEEDTSMASDEMHSRFNQLCLEFVLRCDHSKRKE